ncbi:MAG: ligand-binding SRPBCC domain-containing protein [Planctomycetota bacterium]|jgi:ligand-binding SRPBCC domain-containing protein
MKRYDLKSQLRLERSVQEVFPFFTDPRNLEALTPSFLNFRVLGMSTDEIGEGTEIDYSLKLRGIPIRWRSQITDWNPPFDFVDTQIRGPYRFWHHLHGFQADGDATIATDHVTYAVYGGGLVHRWFVRPELERIFDYRKTRMTELLPETTPLLT